MSRMYLFGFLVFNQRLSRRKLLTIKEVLYQIEHLHGKAGIFEFTYKANFFVKTDIGEYSVEQVEHHRETTNEFSLLY